LARPSGFRHDPRVALNPDLPPVDVDTPNAARMYDYHLGGSHNFAADRAAAERTRAAMPWVAVAMRTNRAFLGRAVRFCQSEGIDQFLDLGSGIPTVGNVHEVARATDPGARVAYVDHEPVAVITSEAVLDGDPLTSVLHADLRDPGGVLAGVGLLDLGRPVALLSVAVLHFVPDADDPAAIMARYRARLAPGSMHVLSHATADHDPEVAAAAAATYRSTSNPITPRSRAQIMELLAGTDLVEPGLVDASEWRPDDPAAVVHAGYYAAVGRIA
jgi:hypothetical protein